MASHRMSRVDTAWLRMDNAVNLMVIVGVWRLRPAITLPALRQRVQERLLRFERFRQRVEHDASGASWVDDDGFELERHVRAEVLRPAPGQSAEAALQARCGELASTPLDMQRPLWCFHLIEDYDGGSALVARIHHCIGDGIALIAVMLSITDGAADAPAQPHDAAQGPGERHEPGHGHGVGEDWLADAVLKPLTELTVRAIAMYGQGVTRSLEALTHPQQLLSLQAARTGVQVLGDVAALALLADDSPTRLKGHGSGRKRVAWNQPLPLDEVKAVGRALGCSVNDVLLACVAGAIGAYLRGCGDDPAGQEIRAMVPVNLRPPHEALQLGNRFGLAPLVLPIGIDNPVERVYAVRQRMQQLKGSYQPLLAFAVLSLAGLMAKPVQDGLLNLFARKATAVMTNVPGPQRPLRFLDATIEQTLFWVPASGDIGLGVSILSYAGGVQFGLITDARLCPDPQAIIERFAPEFEKLLWLTLMLPWGELHR